MFGHSAQVKSAGSVLDEHQHVQPLEEHRLDDQEVTGDDGVRLDRKELPPGRSGPPRRGIDDAASPLNAHSTRTPRLSGARQSIFAPGGWLSAGARAGGR
jgi:hypothetical protein